VQRELRSEDINRVFFVQKMKVELEKMLSCEHIVDVMNEMVGVIYGLKREGWVIEFE
jgi:hypothetical protein